MIKRGMPRDLAGKGLQRACWRCCLRMLQMPVKMKLCISGEQPSSIFSAPQPSHPKPWPEDDACKRCAKGAQHWLNCQLPLGGRGFEGEDWALHVPKTKRSWPWQTQQLTWSDLRPCHRPACPASAHRQPPFWWSPGHCRPTRRPCWLPGCRYPVQQNKFIDTGLPLIEVLLKS